MLMNPKVEDKKSQPMSKGKILELVGLPNLEVQLGALLAAQTYLRPFLPLGMDLDLSPSQSVFRGVCLKAPPP
jgi:hypothetical protein